MNAPEKQSKKLLYSPTIIGLIVIIVLVVVIILMIVGLIGGNEIWRGLYETFDWEFDEISLILWEVIIIIICVLLIVLVIYIINRVRKRVSSFLPEFTGGEEDVGELLKQLAKKISKD